MPADDHGKGHAGVDRNGKAITTKTFQAAAEAFEMSAAKSKKSAHKTLGIEVKGDVPIKVRK
jgi:hypothetical protein